MSTHYAIIGYIAGRTGTVAKLGQNKVGPSLFDSTGVGSGVSADADFPTQYRVTFVIDDGIPAGDYDLYLFSSDGDVLAQGERTFLGVDGETAADRAAVLDSATQAQIDAIEASTAGTVSGAGTGTEIFVGTNVTLTITVDADGNRSSVVVS